MTNDSFGKANTKTKCRDSQSVKGPAAGSDKAVAPGSQATQGKMAV